MNLAQAVDPFAPLRGFTQVSVPYHVQKYRVTRRNVYETIQRMEGCKIASIQASTGHKRRSLHAILQAFIREGLVRREGQKYYTTMELVITSKSEKDEDYDAD